MAFSLFAIISPNRGDNASDIRRPIRETATGRIGLVVGITPGTGETTPLLYECAFRAGRVTLAATAFTLFRGEKP